MNPVISVKNLSVSYPNGPLVLKEVTFDVEKGACLALLGANGSGKTSLLYVLSGVIPHVISGKVIGQLRIADLDPRESGFDEIIRRVGLVQQDPESQIVATRVEAECAFGPSNLGLEREEIKSRIHWALKSVSLYRYERNETRSLSYGQKQRLTIAAALAMKPQVLLLDEPFSNIDAPSRSSILKTLKELKDIHKMTLVISTHDISRIIDIVDYVLLLSKDGEQLKFGSLREVIRDISLLHKARVQPPPLLQIGVQAGLPESPLEVEQMCAKIIELLKIQKYANQTPALSIPLDIIERPKVKAGIPILETRGLSFSYPEGQQALSDVDLCIHEGDFVGIIGPNGSGKTTLIKHFVGLLKPTRGVVRFHGRNVKEMSVGQLASHIGMVLQNPDHQLIYRPTVYDEVAYGIQMGRDIDGHAVHTRIAESLEIVGLEDKQDLYPGKLSFGEKKKLLLACMLARNPEVLVLDEPLFGLDYSGKLGLVNVLESINQNGVTIVMVTHDIDTISKCAGRLITMYQGRIVLDDETLKVLTNPGLERYDLEPPQVIQLARCLASKGVRVNLTVNQAGPGHLFTQHNDC